MKLFDLQGDGTLREYARMLDASDDYRVLRRLPREDELWLVPTPSLGPDVTIGVIDVETTGLDDNAKIIEIALLKMELVDGQLAQIGSPFQMLEDPREPLKPEIVRITGLTDDDLRGRRFDENRFAEELGSVDVLCAFNAKFDAGHLRARFSGLLHPWVCARSDYDWAADGHEGRSQQALVASMGHFYEAHRAAADIWALSMLIAMPAPDGRTIAAHLVDRGRKLETRITAMNAPFAVKDQLKGRGYRWNPRHRHWSIDVAPAAAATEVEALGHIHPLIRPVATAVDWFDRHLS
jgi:DNA polymerase-3 subunit epsilon